MSSKDKTRIAELQRQVRIAREALNKIKRYSGDPSRTAATAIEKMWPLDVKQPLQGVVGHGGRR